VAERRLTWRIRAAEPRAVLVREEEVSGRLCYVLEYGVPDPVPGTVYSYTEFAVWVSPDLGYAVVRWEATGHKRDSSTPDAGKAYRMRREYHDFVQYGQDLWLPQAYTLATEKEQHEGGWRVTSSVEARAQYLRVNVQIPLRDFKPPRPLRG
jgi:hypothetical protein